MKLRTHAINQKRVLQNETGNDGLAVLHFGIGFSPWVAQRGEFRVLKGCLRVMRRAVSVLGRPARVTAFAAAWLGPLHRHCQRPGRTGVRPAVAGTTWIILRGDRQPSGNWPRCCHRQRAEEERSLACRPDPVSDQPFAGPRTPESATGRMGRLHQDG